MLMGLGLAGFALGVTVRFEAKPPRPIAADPKACVYAGRLLILVPIVRRAYQYAVGSVAERGYDQTVRGLGDAIGVAASISVLVGTVLLLAGQSDERKPIAPIDWLLLLLYAALTGLVGDRGSVISLVVLVLLFLVARPSLVSDRRRRRLIVPVAMGALALALAFSYRTVMYRSGSAAQPETGVLETLVRDWASVPFTTGHVASATEVSGYYWGSTILMGLVRQIPSPLVNRFIGPADDTGAMVFRDLYPTDASHGWGFSIIAEGVLNFGTLGAFLLPAAAGMALAWFYSRSDPSGHSALNLVYYVAAASVPIAWRSDVLGAVKTSLYALVILWVVLLVARAVTKSRVPSDRQGGGRVPSSAIRHRAGDPRREPRIGRL